MYHFDRPSQRPFALFSNWHTAWFDHYTGSRARPRSSTPCRISRSGRKPDDQKIIDTRGNSSLKTAILNTYEESSSLRNKRSSLGFALTPRDHSPPAQRAAFHCSTIRCARARHLRAFFSLCFASGMEHAPGYSPRSPAPGIESCHDWFPQQRYAGYEEYVRQTRG